MRTTNEKWFSLRFNNPSRSSDSGKFPLVIAHIDEDFSFDNCSSIFKGSFWGSERLQFHDLDTLLQDGKLRHQTCVKAVHIQHRGKECLRANWVALVMSRLTVTDKNPRIGFAVLILEAFNDEFSGIFYDRFGILDCVLCMS